MSRDGGLVEIETAAGVVYEIEVPTTVFRRVPLPGQSAELRTLHVVREDSAALYGFVEAHERELFRRLLGASGVGPKVALAMMSTLTPPRLARALVEKDLAALTQVPGVGKKTAEKISVELADRVNDLAAAAPGSEGGTLLQGAVQALVALGYSYADADIAIRSAVEQGEAADTEELVRRALALQS